MQLVLTSTEFTDRGIIPRRYTCEGEDISPPLIWSGTPERTKSFALIVDDPDAPDPAAPRMIWTHWVMYNLPPKIRELPAGISSEALPPGIGRHRYFHKLYALDVVLPELGVATKEELEEAMQGHILAKAVLVGTYEKGG
jgi:phosphatidylethanolamine-binding protein (PEBP) family uncharacterized protein